MSQLLLAALHCTEVCSIETPKTIDYRDNGHTFIGARFTDGKLIDHSLRTDMTYTHNEYRAVTIGLYIVKCIHCTLSHCTPPRFHRSMPFVVSQNLAATTVPVWRSIIRWSMGLNPSYYLV